LFERKLVKLGYSPRFLNIFHRGSVITKSLRTTGLHSDVFDKETKTAPCRHDEWWGNYSKLNNINIILRDTIIIWGRSGQFLFQSKTEHQSPLFADLSFVVTITIDDPLSVSLSKKCKAIIGTVPIYTLLY